MSNQTLKSFEKFLKFAYGKVKVNQQGPEVWIRSIVYILFC